MEEIKVGEYVRFRDGNIRKVIKRDVDNNIILDRLWRFGCGVTWVTKIEEKEDIIKHSFNIIDLIEVGDYVNGYKVKDIQLWNTFFNGKHEYKLDFGELGTMKSGEIRTVVTKEQMEASTYHVI